ncbi:MAG: leucine-rich repeat domain-containing protein, partial [Bacteroidales bacterium]|nr:leucine-rich repeat domain-containing protein [Bacteroidales bacterium]
MKHIYKLLTLLAATAALGAQADTFMAGGLYYQTTGTSQVAVAPVPRGVNTVYSGRYIIPEQVYYNGANYSVTSIADSAFCHSLATEVQIPNTVTAIGNYAFAYDEALTSVTLPLKLQKVSTAMLAGTSLVNIAVPEGVTSIGEWAFQSASLLHTALLPSTTTKIEAYGFNNCHSLAEIYCAAPTPPNATGWAIFSGLSGIDVVVPDDDAVKAYGQDAVWGNDSTFTLYPNEDLSVTMSGELEQADDHYMR